MASSHNIPHFILMPLMAQGHQIPMVDMAKVLSSHGVTVTIVTTPQNLIRFDAIIDRAVRSGLEIRTLCLRFPSAEAGLPEGCESVDTLPSIIGSSENFFKAVKMLGQELEEFLSKAKPRPSCVVSDRYLPWTSKVAQKFRIPRLVFDGTSCLNFMCSHNIRVSKVHESVVSEFEPFLVPNLPDRIELTRAQLPESFNPRIEFSRELHGEIDEADKTAYGLVINTFEELEKDYLREARKIVKGGKVWAIGPLSLCNEDKLDMSLRGNKSTVDEDKVMKWLDSRPAGSVLYVCLGTLGALKLQQMVQLGLALEASKRPFVWVLRGGRGSRSSDELEEMISELGLEERGLLVRGWAPQALILGHEAVGGFLTHCGWNSVIEGVSAGVPMLTWPMFADQFYNERFVTQVLRVGVGVGVDRSVRLGEEESCDVVLKSEDIGSAIEKLMGVGEIRQRAREIRERANKAMEKGGSSCSNVSTMIQDVMQHLNMIN